MTHPHTNSLIQEKSPYLLQHAHNPVDWFAWNETAFAKARTEDKPILLSIGYSTCHWCHVMERESFEDEKVGAFLKEHFVSIKVDREERPDVDKIYMTFVQSTTGSGGWPLNVFLTPDLKPFFGGTYFPPEPRHGRPSFLQLLQQIAQLWRERKIEIAASADELHARLELVTAREAREDAPLTPNVLRQALGQFKEAYDPENGGFGGAPKFPQPSIPSFVLRAAKRFGDDAAKRMVLQTCEKMAEGGIHDQLGGGFARYAVDAQWLVPHFEKMLYDNAQLVQLYLDAHLNSRKMEESTPHPGPLPIGSADSADAEREERSQLLDETASASGSKDSQKNERSQPLSPLPAEEGQGEGDRSAFPETNFAAVARDILDYVLRDMTHPDGGFYSAEDADSEGHEGKFYCWTHDELAKLLSPEEFIVAANHFGITKEGNFVDHSHPTPLPGQNVLSVVNSIGRAALPCGQADQQVSPTDLELLVSAKAKMLAVRAQRIRPHLDDKILASWNGLMLGAFARAGIVLGEEKYLAAAEKNLKFIREKLWQCAAGVSPADPANSQNFRQAAGSTLFHRWRDGERDNVQLLEGYAFLLDGVIHLYEATLKPRHLDFACELAGAMIAKFYDPANGGFWQSTAGANDLILRVKDDYDGAEPSGNSVATLALLKLGKITGREAFTQAAEQTLQLAAMRLQQQPAALAYMLQALDFWLDEPRRVVIAGQQRAAGILPADPTKENKVIPADETPTARFKELLRATHSVYQPNKIVLGTTGAVEPFAKTLAANDEAMVFVCLGNACQLPTSEPTKVRELLN